MFWIRGKNNKDWACSKCGKLNHPDGEFCEFCGQSRHQVVVTQEAPATIPGPSHDVMKCPVCGAECEKDDLFCSACGTSLRKTTPPTIPVQEIVPEPPRQEPLVRCVHCGTMNDAHNRFCSHCSEEVRVSKEETPILKDLVKVSASFCPECGARCDNETAFCLECGAKLTVAR